MIILLGNIIFFIAFAFYLVMPYIKSRQKMLFTVFLGAFFCAVSFWLLGEMAGAYSSLIACFVILINASVKDKHLEKTFKLRLACVVIFSVIFAYYSVNSFADILPFIATVGARLCETLKNPSHIRKGHAVTLLIWTAYVASTGNYFILTLELFRSATTFFAIYRDEKANISAKKAQQKPFIEQTT